MHLHAALERLHSESEGLFAKVQEFKKFLSQCNWTTLGPAACAVPRRVAGAVGVTRQRGQRRRHELQTLAARDRRRRQFLNDPHRSPDRGEGQRAKLSPAGGGAQPPRASGCLAAAEHSPKFYSVCRINSSAPGPQRGPFAAAPALP